MRIVTQSDELADVCASLRQAPFVAVDTEFMRETTYWPVLCLVQAAGGDTEVIIDPMADGLDLGPLLDLMLDDSVLKVFHAARQDMEIFVKMAMDAGRGMRAPGPVFDSQVAGAAIGLGDSIAYDGLVRQMLGREVDKSSRFTDWARRPLSDNQLSYAIADVTHLRDLYPMMVERLENAGRGHWLDEEMAALADANAYITLPPDAWKRLKLRKTSKPYLAVLNAAATWREETAQSENRPRSRILKDDALYEIAQSRPASIDALGQLRAVPNGFERSRFGRALIDALAPALADPDAHAPPAPKPKPTPPGLGPTVDLLKVLLRLKAEEHEVAARLLATTSDLERIAADDAAEVPALSGWRREVFGDAALSLKRGETALRLAGDRVVAEPVSVPQPN